MNLQFWAITPTESMDERIATLLDRTMAKYPKVRHSVSLAKTEHYILAMNGASLVGVIGYRLMANKPMCILSRFAVHSAHREGELGKELFRHLERRMTDLSITAILLDRNLACWPEADRPDLFGHTIKEITLLPAAHT